MTSPEPPPAVGWDDDDVSDDEAAAQFDAALADALVVMVIGPERTQVYHRCKHETETANLLTDAAARYAEHVYPPVAPRE